MVAEHDFKFQSPDGDFVYSDTPHQRMDEGGSKEFQSPDGDFVYSDKRVKFWPSSMPSFVSIP